MSQIVLKPTGNPDKDTAALKRVFAASPGNQSLLESGTFLVNSTLTLQNQGKVSGRVMGCPGINAGERDYGTILRCAPGFAGPLVQSLSVTAGGYWDRAMVEDIAFDGGPAWPNYGVLLVNAGERAIFNRCAFSRFQEAGLWHAGIGAKLRMTECFFSYIRGYFVMLTANTKGKASGLVLLDGCCGDDAGKAFLGLNCNAYVKLNCVKAEFPHSSAGVSDIADVLVEWRTDTLAGVPAQRDCSPILNLDGGSVQMPNDPVPQGTLVSIPSNDNGNGINLRVNCNGLAMPQSCRYVIDDRVNQKQVLGSDHGDVCNYFYHI